MKVFTNGLLALMAAATISCGQQPAFTENIFSLDNNRGERGGSVAGNESSSADGTLNGTSDADDSEIISGATGEDQEMNGNFDAATAEVPGASEGDLSAIRKCLSKFNGGVPFDQSISNYKKIYANVTVFGSGTALSDVAPTREPQLILIAAGVNVLGDVSYDLLNPNGYYCMMVNVNVKQKLTINVDCQARLADSKVSVVVGGSTNGTTAAVGVHVQSDVSVVTKGSGDRCLR